MLIPLYMPDRHYKDKGNVQRMTTTYAYTVVASTMPSWHYLDMDNMSRIREAKGLSQKQLAEMVGANQATISKIESGAGNPTLGMMTRIAKALDVHPSDLFAKTNLEQRVMEALSQITDPSQKEAAIIVLESMAHKAR